MQQDRAITYQALWTTTPVLEPIVACKPFKFFQYRSIGHRLDRLREIEDRVGQESLLLLMDHFTPPVPLQWVSENLLSPIMSS